MEKTVEVELRGLIDREKYSDLLKFFRKNGIAKGTKNRILIDYSTFLKDEGVRERKKDIRLRVTNGIPEIIIKLGNWGGSEHRKELSVLASKGEFDKLVQIYAALGLTKGVLCIRNTEVFMYKGIEFALVEVPGHSYYFEAEKMLTEKDDVIQAKKEVESVIAGLKLHPFTDEEFYKYIEKLNVEANEIFDYSTYKDNYFRDRFNL
jgi:adenylate cyclase class IV